MKCPVCNGKGKIVHEDPDSFTLPKWTELCVYCSGRGRVKGTEASAEPEPPARKPGRKPVTRSLEEQKARQREYNKRYLAKLRARRQSEPEQLKQAGFLPAQERREPGTVQVLEFGGMSIEIIIKPILTKGDK